jgi:hypothetical protein
LSGEDPSFTGLIPRVREYVEFKGMDWCIAAMVHGSIEYYSYDTAKRLIGSVLNGGNWVCERTMDCFRANAAKETLNDSSYFEYVEKRDPEYGKHHIVSAHFQPTLSP